MWSGLHRFSIGAKGDIFCRRQWIFEFLKNRAFILINWLSVTVDLRCGVSYSSWMLERFIHFCNNYPVTTAADQHFCFVVTPLWHVFKTIPLYTSSVVFLQTSVCWFSNQRTNWRRRDIPVTNNSDPLWCQLHCGSVSLSALCIRNVLTVNSWLQTTVRDLGWRSFKLCSGHFDWKAYPAFVPN